MKTEMRAISFEEVVSVLGKSRDQVRPLDPSDRTKTYGLFADGKLASVGAVVWESPTKVRFKMQYTLPDFRRMGFGLLLPHRGIHQRRSDYSDCYLPKTFPIPIQENGCGNHEALSGELQRPTQPQQSPPQRQRAYYLIP